MACQELINGSNVTLEGEDITPYIDRATIRRPGLEARITTQAFGDLFVLLMLGWATGFLLALPKIAAMYLELAERRRAALAKASNTAEA